MTHAFTTDTKRKAPKKQRSKRRGESVADAPKRSASEQEGIRLADLRALAVEHFEKNAWNELLEIGRLSVSAIQEDDRKEAQIWLPRLKATALWPPDGRHFHELSEETREEVREALCTLAERVEVFHSLPEFDRYLHTHRWTLEDNAHVFPRLAQACREVANMQWIRELRGRSIRLLNFDFDEGDSEERRLLLASMPDIEPVLSEAYSTAERNAGLEEEDAWLIKVLRIESDMRKAKSGDFAKIAESVRRLPSPSADDLRNFLQQQRRADFHAPLTPQAWAFRWELEHTTGAGFPELKRRYPNSLASPGCEGLRLILHSLVSAPSDADELLTQAVATLTRLADNFYEWFGESIALVLPGGTREIYVGPPGLRMASVEDLLTWLIEHAPRDYTRRNELIAFCRIFEAILQYSPVEVGDESIHALDWLFEHSIPFQFATSSVVQGTASRMRLLVDALRRAVEAGSSLSNAYFWGELEGEDLTPQEAVVVLDSLEPLVAVRPRMNQDIQRIWQGAVAGVFAALSSVTDVQGRVLKLARECRADLLEAGESFRLAYLEQVAGDARHALSYYLVNFDTSQNLQDVAVKNARLLWTQSSDPKQVKELIAQLRLAVETSSRADVVQQLLLDAEKRYSSLLQETQFEKTAVNRWPSITGPARKLLAVLATIQSYKSFGELGEYAGMDALWAERHYNKLVDTGMLLVSKKGYRINPHIAPLVERESQHAVIGRIIRAQGQNAVKQVFNSEREFTIYQALVQLCPNHLVFPNSSLQSIMNFDRMKELVSEDDFGYYLRASVDVVVVSTTTYLPMLAIEVDSIWHDTERQQKNDEKKDRLFAAAGIPFMRLRPVGTPSENTIRVQVAEHIDELVRTLREDLPGYEQARGLLEDLSRSSRT
jgi:hypothetical protein